MWTVVFWKAVFERAVRTFAGTLGGAFAVSGIGITSIDWKQSLSVAVASTIASVLLALATGAVTGSSPALTEVPKPVNPQPGEPIHTFFNKVPTVDVPKYYNPPVLPPINSPTPTSKEIHPDAQ